MISLSVGFRGTRTGEQGEIIQTRWMRGRGTLLTTSRMRCPLLFEVSMIAHRLLLVPKVHRLIPRLHQLVSLLHFRRMVLRMAHRLLRTWHHSIFHVTLDHSLLAHVTQHHL
jgi:hypothetical protein